MYRITHPIRNIIDALKRYSKLHRNTENAAFQQCALWMVYIYANTSFHTSCNMHFKFVTFHMSIARSMVGYYIFSRVKQEYTFMQMISNLILSILIFKGTQKTNKERVRASYMYTSNRVDCVSVLWYENVGDVPSHSRY